MDEIKEFEPLKVTEPLINNAFAVTLFVFLCNSIAHLRDPGYW